MKIQATEYEKEFGLSLIPETIEESSLLARLNIKSNMKETTAQMYFEKNSQCLFITIPQYKNRKSMNAIENKDLKIF